MPDYTVTITFPKIDAADPETAAVVVAELLTEELDPWMLTMDVNDHKTGWDYTVRPSTGVVA
jgi:hypothetical protein